MRILYGTGNTAKLSYMSRVMAKWNELQQAAGGESFKLKLVGLTEIAAQTGITPPEIEEVGDTPLHNARIKAKAYFDIYGMPVISCDTGLYLRKEDTGEELPGEEQPGIHVRMMNGKRLSDEELLARITGLVRKYGLLEAQYKTAICFMQDKHHIYESDADELSGEAFLFTDIPHEGRKPDFPLDCISLQKSTGNYYYDLAENAADDLVANTDYRGFLNFFKRWAKND